jgi:23S rRNA pseudouridine2605 synthase
MSDPEGRSTVQDLLKGIKTRVYPVGRLDYNTEGLLLMTNDGDFAHLITHPKHEFPKTYLAKVKGVLDERAIEMLEKGMFLQDGKTAPAKVKKIRKEEMNSWVEITIHEGRKRQVRRMFDHVGARDRLKGSEGPYRSGSSRKIRNLSLTKECAA